MNVLMDAYYGLGKSINKMRGGSAQENKEGVVSDKLPELTLELDNEQLIKLTQKWEENWNKSDTKTKWEKQCEENEKYWLGEHYDRIKADKTRPDVDNAIFEAVETYLPQVTRRNPEAMVELESGEDISDPQVQAMRDAFVKNLKNKLGDIADELKFRLKLKKVVRHWAIYVLGAAKMGWDVNKDIPTMKAVRAKKLILDPDSTVDEDGYTGKYVGEYRKLEAGTLIKMLEAIGGEQEAVKTVKDLVKEDLGTDVQFIEWSTDEYMCWTLGKQVLLKKKNPHWNYDTQNFIPAPADAVTGEVPLNPETGEPMGETQTVPGQNHFKVPKKPYIFLAVFNLGTKPVDDTSLIGQNLSNQDRLNKRNKQIDRNVDNMNGGVVVSLARAGLTKEQAERVVNAWRKGGIAAIPDGIPREAIDRIVGSGLPADVFNDRQDTRNRLTDIFGVRGSTAGGIQTEKTVRGKYQVRNLDTDRIGGGVSEYVEQFADDAYNWIVQLLYVYDDVWSQMKDKPKVRITIKEGSLLPKDSTTIANQAIDLASAGKMSLVDMYKALERPNPEELAVNAWLEVNAPDVLYAHDPRVAQVVAAKAQSANAAEQKPPSQSINFKDLPPDAQAQMLAKVGITMDPEGIAIYDAHKAARDKQNKQVDTPPENDTAEA